MGILSDFVIADATAAVQVGESENPSEQWPTFHSRGVDNIKLATLYCVITGSVNTNEVWESFALVGGNKEEGPWVLEFPSQILHSIASLDPSRIPSIAQHWATTDELKADRWSVDVADSFIRQLSGHAAKAVQSGKALFLRLSI